MPGRIGGLRWNAGGVPDGAAATGTGFTGAGFAGAGLGAGGAAAVLAAAGAAAAGADAWAAAFFGGGAFGASFFGVTEVFGMMVLDFPALTVVAFAADLLFGGVCPSLLCLGPAFVLLGSSLVPLLLRCGKVAPALAAGRAFAPVRRSDLADEGRAARFTLTDMGNQPILVQGFLPDPSGETMSKITLKFGEIQLCTAATMPQRGRPLFYDQAREDLGQLRQPP